MKEDYNVFYNSVLKGVIDRIRKGNISIIPKPTSKQIETCLFKKSDDPEERRLNVVEYDFIGECYCNKMTVEDAVQYIYPITICHLIPDLMKEIFNNIEVKLWMKREN